MTPNMNNTPNMRRIRESKGMLSPASASALARAKRQAGEKGDRRADASAPPRRLGSPRWVPAIRKTAEQQGQHTERTPLQQCQVPVLDPHFGGTYHFGLSTH